MHGLAAADKVLNRFLEKTSEQSYVYTVYAT